MVVAPLVHRGTAVGVLKALSNVPGHFDMRATQTLQLMGGFIAASLSHARRLEELSRLNEALDDFSAHVAHDLHNPIFAMAMAGAELRRRLGGAGGTDVSELVSVIEQQAAHSGELVGSLLDLARAGRTPRRMAFDVGEVVDAACGIAGITLVNECRGVTVVADRVAVRQALANLLSNAARHAAAGGVAAVTVSCEESPGGWRVLVADRGPGLRAADRQRAFAAFERGPGSAHVDGSGLGLAIVAAVAQAHGGEPGYEPRPGGGSVFWFSLLRGSS
jgi:signal transduction histidine kinase